MPKEFRLFWKSEPLNFSKSDLTENLVNGFGHVE
jgi:hypothetical protein